MMASRTLRHAIFAISAALVLSGAEARTVSAGVQLDAAGKPVGIAVSFGTAQPDEVNSLFIAYGMTDGGATTNGWEKVRRVNFVSPDGASGSVVVEPDATNCMVPLPDDLGEPKYLRVFLFAGETGVPYELRYDSMFTTRTSTSGSVNEDGTWIDTGVVPGVETSIRIEFKTTAAQPMFGVAGNFYCFANGTPTTYCGFLGSECNRNIPTRTDDGNRHTVRLGKDGAWVDDELVGEPVPKVESAIGPIILFGRSNNVSPRQINRYDACTIYSADIFDGGRAIRSYVGVRANGVNCLYDCVGGRLYYSQDNPASTYPPSTGTLVSTVVAEAEQTAVSEVVSLDASRIFFESVSVDGSSVTFGWSANAGGDVFAVLTERDTGKVSTNLLQEAAAEGSGAATLTRPFNVPYTARLVLMTGEEIVESVDREFDMPLGDPQWIRGFRSEITFPGFTLLQALTNFPALVKLAKDRPAGFDPADCSAGGADLLFADADGNRLSYEIDTWDPEGMSYVWVSVPSLSAGMSVFLYWKDTGKQRVATRNDPKSVWKDYAGVWHLNEPEGTAFDSTEHGLNAEPKGARAAESVGSAGGAVGIARRNVNVGVRDGSRLEVPSKYSSCCDILHFTISGFFKRNGTWQGELGQYPRILSNNGSGATYDGWGVNVSNSSGSYTVRGAKSSPAAGVPAGMGPSLVNWGHVAAAYDGTKCSFYGDGVQLVDGATITAAGDNGKALSFGSVNDDGDHSFDGWMDEIRLYNGVMSAARAQAEYATMGAHDTFTAYGAAQVCSGGDGTISVSSVEAGEHAVTFAGRVTDDELNPVEGATVTVFYGPDADHLQPGADTTTAADGSFSVTLTSLLSQAEYAYRMGATGPVSCQTFVSTFRTAYVPRHSRLKKCELAFPGYVAREILADFPVLVRLSEGHPVGFSYADCNPDGSDLSAADMADNPLDVEIETWNTSGESLVWVRVPRFLSGMHLNLYWGRRADAGVVPADPRSVWRGYAGVWHLDESEGTANDSTGHGLDGAPSGEAAAQMVVTNDAVIGGARVNVNAGNGTGSYLLVPSYNAHCNGTHFTASGFFKLTSDRWPGSTGAVYPRLFSRGAADWNTSDWVVNLSNAPGSYSLRGTGVELTTVSGGPLLTNTWAHFTVVYDDTLASLYVDGTLLGAGTVTAPGDFLQPLAVGCRNDGKDYSFGGLIDEVRLAPGSATPNRVKAEYDTMAENASFTAYGAAEPSSGEGLVMDRLALVSTAEGFDLQGVALQDDAPAVGATVTVRLGADPAALAPLAAEATTDANGAFRLALDGLEPGTVCFCQATVSLNAVTLTTGIRRLEIPGASYVLEFTQSAQDRMLITSGSILLGAGVTKLYLQIGDSPDALDREVELKTFPVGSTDGSFSVEFDMAELPRSFYKLVCRNAAGARAWSDETQAVTRQFPSDKTGALYTWNGGASGVWDEAGSWVSANGLNGWPYTAASSAVFPAGGAVEVTSVPDCFVRELSFARGAEVGVRVSADATLVVTDDPLVTNGTVNVTDTDLRLKGGRLACEAINFTRTADGKPCALTVSDGGELWLGGSATMTTTGTRAELHVVGTGSVQLGRPDDGNALWKLSDGAKMFLGSERSNVRKSFEGSNALLEVTNGVHAGTIKFQAGARDNLARVSGPTTVVTSMLYLDSVATAKNNLVLVEKGATYALPQAFRDIRGTSNVVRIVDTTFTCPSFGADPGAYGVVFGSTANAGPGNGVEFCGTSPKLTVADAWGSGTSSGVAITNAARLVFSVTGAGYSAVPITVGGTATVYGNTVFEVRVAKGTRQFSIPLMTVASTPWAEEGHLKAVVDRLNAVAVLPKNAKLVVSKDGKTLFCKRPSGMLLFVK